MVAKLYKHNMWEYKSLGKYIFQMRIRSQHQLSLYFSVKASVFMCAMQMFCAPKELLALGDEHTGVAGFLSQTKEL